MNRWLKGTLVLALVTTVLLVIREIEIKHEKGERVALRKKVEAELKVGDGPEKILEICKQLNFAVIFQNDRKEYSAHGPMHHYWLNKSSASGVVIQVDSQNKVMKFEVVRFVVM